MGGVGGWVNTRERCAARHMPWRSIGPPKNAGGISTSGASVARQLNAKIDYRWPNLRRFGLESQFLTDGSRLCLPESMPVPESLPWMESVDAKMDRAKEHLDTLNAEAGIFFESTKRHFILKTDGHA